MNREVLDHYDRAVPRYTSYPTAPHFHAGVTADRFATWLGALPGAARLSLYVHIPFCDRLCWFCGCTTKQTHKYAPISAYIEVLSAEIAAIAKALDGRGIVTALHFGGGSPSMLTPQDLHRLDTLLRSRFTFAPDAQISFEIDPNDMDEVRFDALAAIGLTRASLGVQDFDEKVQTAINRLQSFEQTASVVDALRRRGVRSVNLDLLYGLPHQSEATLGKTVTQSLSLHPDRVALFGYAHVPWMKKHQRMIDQATLPGMPARFAQQQMAGDMLRSAAYAPVGFDHFALPGDSMAQAVCTGSLRRNFQGYTTDRADALIGLGASSVSQLPQGYAQNAPSSGDYAARIARDGFATLRGFELSDRDRARAFVIEQLLCNFSFSVAELHARFGRLSAAIIQEARALVESEPNGFFRFEPGEYLVPPGGRFYVPLEGRPLVRALAAHFDTYLRQRAARHSVAV